MDIAHGHDSQARNANELWFGHPKGLIFLAATEAWERFSFYGMRALLILYMVQELLLPGHIENVAGMASFRAAIESVLGPLSTQAFASQIFGLYAGLVYFTPIIGGLIADRWLGAKKTVLIGIVLMTLGHFAMAFEVTILLALTLLVLGSGCLKGNIAAQVGYLYPKSEEAQRTRGFTIFSTGINIGAILGPMVCGLLAQVYGWHVGFGAAGLLMIVAAVTYFVGFRHYNERTPDQPVASNRETFSATQRKMLLLVVLIMCITMCQLTAYDQMFNVGMIWAADHVDLMTSFGSMPVPWFVSLDSLAAVLVVPLLIALWRWQAKRNREPDDLSKMAIGAAVMAASTGALALGSWLTESGSVPLVYALIGFALSGAAFMWTWPTMLALVSRRAPASINAMMMAAVYLTAFVTGVGSGYIAIFYESMGATAFWVMHTLISLTGMAAFVILGPALRRTMDRLDGEQNKP